MIPLEYPNWFTAECCRVLLIYWFDYCVSGCGILIFQSVTTLWLDSSRLVEDSTRYLNTFSLRHCFVFACFRAQLIQYSSFRCSNDQSVLMLLIFLASYSIFQSVNRSNDTIRLVLWMMRFSWWCHDDTSFAMRPYSFSLPTTIFSSPNTTFLPHQFVLLLLFFNPNSLLLSLLYYSCSCRLLVYENTLTRWFSFRVGCGANCTQYLFCDPSSLSRIQSPSTGYDCFNLSRRYSISY